MCKPMRTDLRIGLTLGLLFVGGLAAVRGVVKIAGLADANTPSIGPDWDEIDRRFLATLPPGAKGVVKVDRGMVTVEGEIDKESLEITLNAFLAVQAHVADLERDSRQLERERQQYAFATTVLSVIAAVLCLALLVLAYRHLHIRLRTRSGESLEIEGKDGE